VGCTWLLLYLYSLQHIRDTFSNTQVHFRVKRVPEGDGCEVPTIMTDTIGVQRCYYHGEFKDCLLLGSSAPYVSQFDYVDLRGSSTRSRLNAVYDGGGYVQNLELGNQNHTVYRPAGIVYVLFVVFELWKNYMNITNTGTKTKRSRHVRPTRRVKM